TLAGKDTPSRAAADEAPDFGESARFTRRLTGKQPQRSQRSQKTKAGFLRALRALRLLSSVGLCAGAPLTDHGRRVDVVAFPPVVPTTSSDSLRPGNASAIRILMNAWRVTPSRRASASIARNRSTGKSTFTRWTSRPGRPAVSRST